MCTAVYEVLAMGVCACTRTTRTGLRSRTEGWGWGGRVALGWEEGIVSAVLAHVDIPAQRSYTPKTKVSGLI